MGFVAKVTRGDHDFSMGTQDENKALILINGLAHSNERRTQMQKIESIGFVYQSILHQVFGLDAFLGVVLRVWVRIVVVNIHGV